MFPAFLTTLFFSISAISARRTARLLGGTEANFWRLAIASLALAAYAHFLGTGLKGSAFWLFFISGIIGFGISDLAFFQSVTRLGSRLTTLMVHCLAAPLAAAVEWLWLGTRLSAVEMGCGAVILAGVALALAPAEHAHLDRKVFWPGMLFGILAAMGQGLGAVISRQAFAMAQAAGENIDGLTATYQRILGGIILSGLVLLVVKRMHLLAPALPSRDSYAHFREKWRGAWGWILLNAMAGPTLGVGCFQWALKTTPAGIVLPIVATMPVVVLPFAVRFEGEKLTFRSVAGGLIAVLGAVMLAGWRH
jgi:drug/metabolite transporter (DMT)-like permease